MIEKKNFLRKPMIVKDFIETSCLFLLIVCLIKLATKADICIIILCVAAVVYAVLQVVDAILQKEDNKNKESWN